MPKPMKFFLPAVFLFLLGIGNMAVGIYKGRQYEEIVAEISVKDTISMLPGSSPLRRIQIAKHVANRDFQQTKIARSKLDFYNLVTFGGQVFVGISLFLFVVSALVKIIGKENLLGPSRQTL